MIKLMPCDLRTLSLIGGTITEKETVHYPTEFLNSIEIAGLPSHKLAIKIRMSLMIMRSFNSYTHNE